MNPATTWPSVTIVPEHADRTKPAVLIPEQDDCLRIAKSLRTLLDHYVDDIERCRDVAAIHSLNAMSRVIDAMYRPTKDLHDALTGVESEVCLQCGGLTDADCRCEEF